MHLYCRVGLLVLTFLNLGLFNFSVSATPRTQAPPTLMFRAVDSAPQANYTVAVLSRVYEKLGIKLKFVEMPRNRSLTEANAGRIDGELGRIEGTGEDYQNLLRVNFPLFASHVVLVANRNECGLCLFDDIDNLAHIGGVQVVEQFLQKLKFNKPMVKVVDLEQLEMMYTNARVQAIMLNDFEAAQLNLGANRYNIVMPVDRSVAYHFLHEKHADLIPQVEAELRAMQANGELQELMQAYGVAAPTFINYAETEVVPDFGEVSIAAGLWRGYTDQTGDGKYWQIVRRVIGPAADKINYNADSYKRAQLGMAEQRFDMLLGTLAGHQPDNAIISRTHIDYDRPLYAFTLDGETMAKLLDGTMNRPVCHVAGYQYAEFLPTFKTMTFYHADSSLDCFAMLDLGRVGAVINYRENLPDWSTSPYSMHKLRDALPIHVAFQNTPRGQRMRDWFDYRMRRFVKSGALMNVYSTAELQRSRLKLSMPRGAILLNELLEFL